jgi:lysine decarboxylase/arginine decarboxylase
MKKIIFINNEEYYNQIEKSLLAIGYEEVLYYDDISSFHRSGDNKNNISTFIICESYPNYVGSIRDNLLMLRYYEYCEPVIILSFLPFGFLSLEEYILNDFSLDASHHWLQLPISAAKIEKTINNAVRLEKGFTPLFVASNKKVIDHNINRKPYPHISNKTLKNRNNMKKETLKILLIEDREDDKNMTIENLNIYKEYHLKDSELDIEIVHFEDGKTVVDCLKELENQKSSFKFPEQLKDLIDVQCVLLDWLLEEKSGQLQKLSEFKLIAEIKSIRPELPIYIYSKSDDGFQIIDECNIKGKTLNGKKLLLERIENEMNGLIAGYFSKNQLEADPASVFLKIINDYNKRKEAPFWEAYKNYIKESKDTWHTPGHARGASFRESAFLKEFYDFFGANTFAADLSVSVEKLGSLLNSTYFVKEAQDKAAKTFGSKHVFFSTNGSSTSNKIIIQTLLRPGEGVIIDRNCHKSVHYGVIQAQAGHVTYLDSKYSSKYRIFAPPSIEEITTKIKIAKEECEKNNIKLKALIITGCTYDGMLIDVNRVVEIAHANQLKVFIDEAWFAYSGFHPMLRKNSAIYSNADYITHSTHKVLSAFSQASYIHVNDPEFDESYFREIFYIYTSTSPQYHIIASLDVASMQMEMEGLKKISEIINRANLFREKIRKLTHLKIVEEENLKNEKNFESFFEIDKINLDPLKVLIDISDLDYDIKEIKEYLLSKGGLEIEKETPTTILVLFTMGTSPDKEYRLYKALQKLNDGEVKNLKRKSKPIDKPVIFPDIKLQGELSLAFFSEKEKRHEWNLEEITKHLALPNKEEIVSVNLITPYPPGIPLLVPNQLIEKDHVEIIMQLIENEVEIHGVKDKKMWIAFDKEINNKNNNN